MPALSISIEPRSGSIIHTDITVERLRIAGWAGRNKNAVQHHIDELAALGIAPPSRTPLFYEVSASLLTTDQTVEILGETSSGEVEPFVVLTSEGLLVGVGSDHTDRKAEAWSVPHSKQLCAKPIGPRFWRHADVAGHWDQLQLRSWIPLPDGTWQLYQDGSVGSLIGPEELIDLNGEIAAGTGLFCGTISAIGGVRPSNGFRMELFDPVIGRSLTHDYRLKTLSIII